MIKKIFVSVFFFFVLFLGISTTNAFAQEYGTYGCFGSSSTGGCRVGLTTNCTNGGVVPNPSSCDGLLPDVCNSSTFNCAAPSSFGQAGDACSTTSPCATGFNCISSVCQASAGTPVPQTQLVGAEKGTWFSRDFLEWYPIVYDTEAGSPETEIFGERYTAAQVEWIIYAWWSFNLHRIIPKEYAACIISNWENTSAMDDCLVKELLKSVGAGALSVNQSETTLSSTPTEKSLLASVFDPRPISGVGYIKEKLSIVPEANAQGFGFNELGFVRDLWVVSRNLAFSLMIMVIVVLSFMVMFRMKTSPQTAISIQTAIPKVFITIILIAFSYAIAGFLIDLVYVVIGVFATMFSQISDKSTLDLYNFMIAGNNNNGLFGILFGYMHWFPIIALIAFMSINVGTFIAGLSMFLMILVALIVFYIIALVTWFRIVWTMLKALLGVIISIITGPFQIMLGAIVPGMGFGTWIRGILSNLAVFAVVGPMLILSIFFLYEAARASTPLLAGFLQNRDIFQNIGINLSGSDAMGWTPPLFAGGDYLALIYLFMSFGILTMIPKISEAIAGFMSGKPVSAGSAIGEALAPTGALGMATLQRGASQNESRGTPTTSAEANARAMWNLVRTFSQNKIK